MNEQSKITAHRQKLLKQIVAWLREYEEAIGEAYGDDDTLEGSAYNLLSNTANFLYSNDVDYCNLCAEKIAKRIAKR